MMTHLTGPPRIGGIAAPYCAELPSLVWDESESTTRTLRDGTVQTVRTRLRGRVTMRWRALDLDTYATLLSELSAPSLDVVVRTKAPSDPAWAGEVTLAMRVRGGRPALADLRTATGELSVELETVAVYAAEPGLVIGGYIYARASDHGHTLDTYGEGTLAAATTTRQVTFGTTTYTLPLVTLGSDAVAGLRTERVTLPSGLRALRIITKTLPDNG